MWRRWTVAAPAVVAGAAAIISTAPVAAAHHQPPARRTCTRPPHRSSTAERQGPRFHLRRRLSRLAAILAVPAAPAAHHAVLDQDSLVLMAAPATSPLEERAHLAKIDCGKLRPRIDPL
jgi:hypothetical protein